MISFELESDRDVLVSGIGLLPAGQPVEVTDEMKSMFPVYHGVRLADANFPPYVKVTAIVANDEGGE